MKAISTSCNFSYQGVFVASVLYVTAPGFSTLYHLHTGSCLDTDAHNELCVSFGSVLVALVNPSKAI